MNDSTEINDNKNFFWHFLDTLLRWRRVILINVLGAAILTFAIAWLFPNWYTAKIILMPPEKETGIGISAGLMSAGLSSILGAGSGLALPGLASPSDLYAAVLKSRVVTEAVVAKNDLKKVFNVKIDEKAVNELLSRTKVIVQREGLISLSYEDTNPQRAANVANSFAAELNRVNKENLTTKAKYLRVFIETRLDEAIRDLTMAEESYKAFQEKYKAISLVDQVKASIEALADLRGQLVLAEIELGVMKKSLSPDNSRYRNQEFKIQQIKEQIDLMVKGDSTLAIESVLSLPIDRTPGLGLELARLTRELKIQETIFELLKQQYEQARIQEMRDTPTVQVLDSAKVPQVKSRPRRTILATLAGLLSAFLTTLFVFGYEFVEREKSQNSQIYQRLTSFSDILQEDFLWLRNIFKSKRDDKNQS